MKFLRYFSQFKKYLFAILPFICFFLGYVLCNLFIGNKTYTTPQLIGLSLHQATQQTSPYHITIQLIAEKDCPGAIPGTIISQKPSAGRLIKSHQSIFVVITKLPASALAPDFLGKSPAVIESLKQENHVKLKTYDIEYNAPKGTCVGQIPQPQQPIVDKKIIAYTAQDKTNKYIMPDLVNQNLQRVVEFLKKNNLTVQVFYKNQKLTPPYQQDLIIISQKPLSGSIMSLQDNAIIQLEVE
ncbi:MAG TPA: PASTA domain-containing protein [Candidatus Saccharimonadales bacterium]|nr:PASTA domain-containing protein [Candidatus Saccharimonadales bacterium]